MPDCGAAPISPWPGRQILKHIWQSQTVNTPTVLASQIDPGIIIDGRTDSPECRLREFQLAPQPEHKQFPSRLAPERSQISHAADSPCWWIRLSKQVLVFHSPQQPALADVDRACSGWACGCVCLQVLQVDDADIPVCRSALGRS